MPGTKATHMISELGLVVFFLRRYRLPVLLIFVVFFISGFLEAASIGSFFPLINSILSENSVPVDKGRFLEIISQLAKQLPLQDPILASSVMLMVLVATSFLVGLFADTVASRYRFRLMVDYQTQVYQKLMLNHYRYFLETKHGELVYIGVSASNVVSEVLIHYPLMVVESFQSLAILALLLSISMKVTSLVFGILLLLAWFFHLLSKKLVYPLAFKIHEVQSGISGLFTESMSGIKQLKVSNSLSFFVQRYLELARRCERLWFISIGVSNFSARFVRFAGMTLVFLSILVLKMFFPLHFKSALPLLAIYVLALHRLIPSVTVISSEWMVIKSLGPRLRTIHSVLSDTRFDKRAEGERYPGFTDRIEFKGVGFSYPSRRDVLKSISFTLPKNSTVGIVGPSGSGKSTISELLVRLYEPESGEIRVDGRDYMSYSLASWLEKTSFVSQDPFIFNMSVADNIRLARPKASLHDVRRAAEMAYAHEFIQKLPHGYDSILGDRGVKLSGGQRQRIAIARALLNDPEILVLDEATSALDNISETYVQAALAEASKNRTTLVIAHRLSTLKHADKIFVLDSGGIVEGGTHDELMERRGRYYELYQAQRKEDQTTETEQTASIEETPLPHEQ